MNREEAQQVLTALPFIQESLNCYFTYHSNKIENNSFTFEEVLTLKKTRVGIYRPPQRHLRHRKSSTCVTASP